MDIDGTVAHMGDKRSPYDYTEVVKLDDPDPVVIRAVNAAHADGITVIMMSGRGETCRGATIEWLTEHGVKFDALFMRGAKDNRPDWIIKDELVRQHIQDTYHVLWCYDDRNQVVDHHRAMGYKVFQVAQGDF